MLKDRLKLLRSTLQLNQRQMASRAGVSQVAWQQYEVGKTVPGGAVLTELALQNINVHWLLTGEGGMFLASEDQPEKLPPEVSSRLERLRLLQGFLDRLGLAELAALATSGHTDDEWSIVTTLADCHPSGLRLVQVQQRLPNMDEGRARTALELLRHRGLVRFDVLAHTYHLQNESALMTVRDLTGHLELLTSTIRHLCTRVLPSLAQSPQQGRLIQAKFSVAPEHEADVIDSLQKSILEVAQRHHAASGTTAARLVVGISLETPTTD